MAATWTGSALQTRYSQKYGFVDTESKKRILEWLNEIQRDIAAYGPLPDLKIKLKKLVSAGAEEIELSPPIPAAPTVAGGSGGSLASASYKAKVTFVIFSGTTAREVHSIESEPSSASSAATVSSGKLSISSIPTMTGSATVNPTTIWRRIYIEKDASGDWVLAGTIQDNTTTALDITADSTSTVAPPEGTLVGFMSTEHPLVEGSSVFLEEDSLDAINTYDPGLSSSGTPSRYARISKRRIRIYPKPSSDITISYWVYRFPSAMFADTTRAIQLPEELKTVLDAGVTWKFYEYKDSDGQEQKLANYEAMKQSKFSEANTKGGQPFTVREVC